MTPDLSALPRPHVGLRQPLPGRLGYAGETEAQRLARRAAEEAHEAACRAEEERLWRWKTTPVWEVGNDQGQTRREGSHE